jgi:hypothetical protein
MATVLDALFQVAVMVAVWPEVTVPAVAVKLALCEPAGTVTDAGVDRALLLSARATVAPPAGAALVRVTEQELAAPEDNVVGLHCTEDSAAGGVMLNDAVLETPPRLAVTVADCVEVTALASTVNVALAEPAGTVTEAGAVR